MMASEERKLATASLIPLEIDPVSALSLSKGVIFDTIVHNIEHTLNNRRTDPLPWKLTGMSLICDPSRNKKYMQKLQKMQCVPSVICTQIYHSKLVITDSGTLTTPGRKIVIPTASRKRLTGIIVCRSLDELLYMESKNTVNAHFIQYKLLSYERIPTRELINGPRLPSVGEKILKTVFDFELTQNNGFPRQLLPVAMISFVRQEACDLCASIRSFLKLPEHQTFDKSYLVTSTNIDLERLREDQERKEEAEAEQEIAWEKIQRRQPLADLSKKSTDTVNARPSTISEAPQRVPPLKIKLPRPDKPLKPSVSIPPLDTKYQCLLKLDKVNLSLYNISNLPNESSSADSTNNKTKSFNITKSYEHHKSLKRLNNSEGKKQSSHSSEIISKEKTTNPPLSIRISTSDLTITSTKEKTLKSFTSIISSEKPSASPIYQPKSSVQKQTVEKTLIKKKVKRPCLPPEYRCSISLPRLDLSMYNIDLPDIPAPASALPMDIEPIMTEISSNSTSSDQQMADINSPVELQSIQDVTESTLVMEQGDNLQPEKEIIPETQQLDNINTTEVSLPITDEFLPVTTDELLPIATDEVIPSAFDEVLLQTTDELLPTATDEVIPSTFDEFLLENTDTSVPPASDEVIPSRMSEILPQTTDESVPAASDELIPSPMSAILPQTSDESVPAATDEVILSPMSEFLHQSTDESLSVVTDEVALAATRELLPPVTDDVPPPTVSDILPQTTDETILSATDEILTSTSNEANSIPVSPISYVGYSPDLPPLDDDPVLFSVRSPEAPITDTSNELPQDCIIIVPCSDDDYEDDDDEINANITKDLDEKIVESLPSLFESNALPMLHNPSLTRILTNSSPLNSHRSSTSSCSSISTSILHNQSPRSALQLIEILLPKQILNKHQQRKSHQSITFERINLSIPLITHEPLIDPRLIYRLQTITTDLRWPSPCNQCSILPHLPSLFSSSTQMISFDPKCSSDFVDPRRESLKNAILNNIYHRIKVLIPNSLIINSNQFQKLLYEETIFKTNCSLHLEYLLHKIKLIDDRNFFHMIKTNDEFQLAPCLLQLIFN